MITDVKLANNLVAPQSIISNTEPSTYPLEPLHAANTVHAFRLTI